MVRRLIRDAATLTASSVPLRSGNVGWFNGVHATASSNDAAWCWWDGVLGGASPEIPDGDVTPGGGGARAAEVERFPLLRSSTVTFGGRDRNHSLVSARRRLSSGRCANCWKEGSGAVRAVNLPERGVVVVVVFLRCGVASSSFAGDTSRPPLSVSAERRWSLELTVDLREEEASPAGADDAEEGSPTAAIDRQRRSSRTMLSSKAISVSCRLSRSSV